ncbi:hypothetical protein GCM10023080_070760 [Streptomyces pseudoechinosporeus]
MRLRRSRLALGSVFRQVGEQSTWSTPAKADVAVGQRGRTASRIRAWVTTWLNIVQDEFPGQRVGVYTSGDDIANGHLPPGVPLWYPAYPWGAAPYSRAEALAVRPPAPVLAVHQPAPRPEHLLPVRRRTARLGGGRRGGRRGAHRCRRRKALLSGTP